MTLGLTLGLPCISLGLSCPSLKGLGSGIFEFFPTLAFFDSVMYALMGCESLDYTIQLFVI